MAIEPRKCDTLYPKIESISKIESEDSLSHLDSLSDELVMKILSHLNSKELDVMSLVSKRMNALANDDQNWKPRLERLGIIPRENKRNYKDYCRGRNSTNEMVFIFKVNFATKQEKIALSEFERLDATTQVTLKRKAGTDDRDPQVFASHLTEYVQDRFKILRTKLVKSP